MYQNIGILIYQPIGNSIYQNIGSSMYQNVLTLLEPQSRFGDKPVKLEVICPQNGTAVLKGLTPQVRFFAFQRVLPTISWHPCFFVLVLKEWRSDVRTRYLV